ncbi:hypothetical protein TIFTF001_017742 [Ficus carica]|uniref:Uncharacterized protein n=1 Tax=Ficus carica TaxID=3494 RepID=A0AA88DB23_FICCA|nr:hypothetical protein TIFTF001_017742 [Ficus carica]
MASVEKRLPAEKNPKKPTPEKKRKVPEAGLKRKQRENEVKESKKVKRTLEEKNADAEEIKGSINLAPMVNNRLMSRYFSILRAVSREHLEVQPSNAKFDNDDDAVKLGLLYMIFAFLLQMQILIPTIVGKFKTKYVEANPHMLSQTSADNVKFDALMSALTTVGEKQSQCFVMMPIDKEMKEPCVAQLYSKKKDSMVVPQAPSKTPVTQLSTATNSDWLEFQK